MSDYKSKHRIVPTLPDGRLLHAYHTTPGRLHRVFMDYREGHIAVPLVNDLDEFFRHLSYGEITFTPDRKQQAADWESYWERVDPEYLPLRTFAMIKQRTEAGQDLYVCRVREDMITQDVIDEMNNEVIPATAGSFRYSRNIREVFWKRAQALADGLTDWELANS